MKVKLLRWGLIALAALFLISSMAIGFVEYNRFKNRSIVFPVDSTIAGVPVGGLDKDNAVDRIQDYYRLPLELEINNTTIQVDPGDLGFRIREADLVEDALQQVSSGNFWDYLWGRLTTQPVQIPLDAAVSENRLRDYITNEIAPRYAQPGSPVQPIMGTTNFIQSQGEQHLDIEQAVEAITAALLSPETHSVKLIPTESSFSEPDITMLQAFLQHNINWTGFDNLAEVYLQSMESGQILHFAVDNGILVDPDIAYTAASTIKIPIMFSVLRRTSEPTQDEVIDLFERMIVFSENPPADTLMSTYLDDLVGPLIVSEDLAALGMENTFLAGYFDLGAPLLQVFETPANSRSDITLDPDIYNQTVPSEVGQLLAGIYTCAADGSGLLTDTFPGEITQSECQLMIDILSANKIGLLIEGGLGLDTTVAHKHGWVQELDGLLHSMSDVAIVFSPGGDYVLCLFIYDPERLDFDQGNRLITRLSQTVYNFFNLENQQYWWFD